MADVCDTCTTFYNRWRVATVKNSDVPDENEEHQEGGVGRYYNRTGGDNNKDIVIETKQREACSTLQADIYAAVILEEQDAISERNKIIIDAALHVKEAAAMRVKGNVRIQEAIDDNELPHTQAQCCIIGDYCQNCYLLNLGGRQAGKSYYCSPLKVNVFGIVDCGVVGGELHAYPYHAGMGKKGGNNVASLFMMYLKDKGWLNEEEPGLELTIIMDNCGGKS